MVRCALCAVRCALCVAEMVLQTVQTVWFIQPGKPVQNACAGRFVGRLRDAGFAAQRFTSLAGARRPVAAWTTGLRPEPD